MIFKTCPFCHGQYIPSSRTQRFCSGSCEKSFDQFQAIRQSREAAEQASLGIMKERRENGETLCVCKVCCSPFYASYDSEFCSPSCEKLYVSNNVNSGIKKAQDAPSLRDVRKDIDIQMIRQKPVRLQNTGIPPDCIKSLQIAEKWAK